MEQNNEFTSIPIMNPNTKIINRITCSDEKYGEVDELSHPICHHCCRK